MSGGWGRWGLVWVCLNLWISVSILNLGWGLHVGMGLGASDFSFSLRLCVYASAGCLCWGVAAGPSLRAIFLGLSRQLVALLTYYRFLCCCYEVCDAPDVTYGNKFERFRLNLPNNHE